MTEEEANQLRKENAELKEELARKDQRIAELEGLLMSALLRIEELERRLAKDSHNSSKPPSSDGFKRKGKKRETGSKPKGGQAGHPGHTLELVRTPNHVVIHRPSHCEECQCKLGAVAGQIKERRQIHDLPVLRLVVTEHQVEVLTCPRFSIKPSAVFQTECLLLPNMGQECGRSRSICRSINCCRWSALARSFWTCSRVCSQKEPWRTGYRKRLARWNQACSFSSGCCWYKDWTMWMKQGCESKDCSIGFTSNPPAG